MNLQKLTIIFLFSFLLFSCSKDKVEVDYTSKSQVDNNQQQLDKNQKKDISYYTNLLGGDIDDLNNAFGSSIDKVKLEKLNNYIKQDNFIEIQELSQNIIRDLKKDDIEIFNTIQNLYIKSILNEGNFMYKQKESSKKAISYIQDQLKKDENFLNGYYINYNLGYAYEIVGSFEKALEYYNKALDYLDKGENNDKLKSVIFNQIGHVYDLSGDLEKAYTNYLKAYELDNLNLYSASNIGRYFSIKGEFEKAKEFYEYASNSLSVAEKSEAYFNLSSIELRIGGFDLDINKSIEYAKKSIQSYDKYPMGYIALARGYYMLNDEKYYKDIQTNLEKAIFLNPNSYLAYRYMALNYLDINNLDKFKEFIDKSSEVVEKDPILMNHNKDYILLQNDMLKIFFNVDLKEYDGMYNGDDYFKSIIEDQLKRKDYGVYKNFKTKQDFLKFYKQIVK